MNRISWKNFLIWAAVIVLTAAFWILITMAAITAIAGNAHAQTGGFVFSPRESSEPHGEYFIGWNTTGSTIYDGTLVMADTSGATSTPQVAIGKGFKTWDGVPANARRILGVLMGNCPGRSQGRIMCRGFHNNVKMAATAYTGFTVLKPSVTVVGAMVAVAASESTTVAYYKKPIGIFQRYTSPDSLRGYVWVDCGGIR